MNADIEDYIGICPTCNSIQRSQAKEPMIAHAIPEFPWQHMACDLFECDGADYVVLVDYYSDFFEVDRLSDKGAATLYVVIAPMASYGCHCTVSSAESLGRVATRYVWIGSFAPIRRQM